ncbi:MAG: c-type cytochrome [Betaproteobacteria bacterium]|nr:c-type cytochrome [Betaproteobacteria bacterium]
MKKITRANVLAALSAVAVCFAASGEAQAIDAGGAQALARKSNCFKCHALDKKKEAVSWKEVAAKYKGKPEAEAKLIKHITTGPKVKFDDGSEEDHPIVKTKDQGDIKNLIAWILSM